MMQAYFTDKEHWDRECKNADCDFFDPGKEMLCGNKKKHPPDCPGYKKKIKEIEREKKKIRSMVEFIIKNYKNNPGQETVDRLVNHFYGDKYRVSKDGR